ncbi:hypothetical protein N656DRAFT_780453 [Canariomyces notabilis]|uniref:Uncharacterized protein n=1 Tax=Canariomyces notabilis TaxID=2074819 RepID=A0AAN6TCA6_9PEZI|nr:hypothetical protein N656DRAFT_780453 [Canariomyces arenarius]
MDDSISDVPIALRRTRRQRQAHGGRETCDNSVNPPAPESMVPCTPKRSKGKKRVRFSDPGPTLASAEEDELSATGLTPMVRRTCLTPSGRSSRRHSTPARLCGASSDGSISGLNDANSPFSGEVRFLPLRQVLDGRVKRRIRRNGLSEEMNTIYAERKRKSQETQAEIHRLKAELAEKDDEIERLHNETVVLDTERVWNLERQVEALKRELANRSGIQQAPKSPSSPRYEWTIAARDPFADDFMELDADNDTDDEAFGESTMADLVSSTPTRNMCSSFPTPPATSPAPEEAQYPRARLATPPSHTGIQVCLPDPEKQQLQEELASLELEVCKLTTTLESYAALKSRIADKLAPFAADAPSNDESEASQPDIEVHLTSVLQTLSDRTAALEDLNTSLSSLGFPGSDASEIINSLRAALRTARLELEYLTPGELTLPLTSAGAEVLDLLLTRLRDLVKRNREADECIDEYHALELSLRQQLSARVDAMDSLRTKLASAETTAREKDARISELQVGLDRLKGAVRGYTRDISELEALVERMESELADKETLQTAHDQTVAALESKLASALEQTTQLQSQLSTLQAHKSEELAALNKAHGRALALRDARVAELRGEVDRVNASLRAAHDTLARLRAENGRLMKLNGELAHENVEIARAVEAEKRQARQVVDAMRAELERVIAKMGEGFLSAATAAASDAGAGAGTGVVGRSGSETLKIVAPGSVQEATTASAVTGTTAASGGGTGVKRTADGLVSGADAGLGAVKKRRKYDSGLGFLDEEEVDTEGGSTS